MSDRIWPKEDRDHQNVRWRLLSGLWGRVCQSEVAAGLRSRSARRRLVVTLVIVLLGLPLIGWLTGQVWAVLTLMVPYAVGSVLLGAATYGLMDKPIGVLDERQRHMRTTIFRDPYPSGATLGLIAGLGVAVAFDAPEALAMGLILVAFGGLYAVPSIKLAWQLTDEVVDDE